MPDLTEPLANVANVLRNLQPQFEGAVLVLLKKDPATRGWARHLTLPDGWRLATERDPDTTARREVLSIFQTGGVNEAAVLAPVWPAFDVVKPDGSFRRYTKVSPLETTGFARKWRFLVRPNTEDRTPTPPAAP